MITAQEPIVETSGEVGYEVNKQGVVDDDEVPEYVEDSDEEVGEELEGVKAIEVEQVIEDEAVEGRRGG